MVCFGEAASNFIRRKCQETKTSGSGQVMKRRTPSQTDLTLRVKQPVEMFKQGCEMITPLQRE